MDDQKRQLRKLKRELKRSGSKRRRRYLRRELNENPEDAAHTDFQFGRDQTAGLNGLDQDSTRRKSAD
jgi:hypothetical protein